MKKMAEIFFIAIWHVIHLPSIKFIETITLEQINAKFLLLSVVSLDIFHMVIIIR